MIFKTCTQSPTRAASGKVLGALRLPLTMYADSRADVYCVIWGVSYFVAWNFWRSSTRNPLVTPLVLRVLVPRPIRWCRLASHVTKRNAHALPTVVAACMITVRALSSLCWSLSLCWGGHFGSLHALTLSRLDRASMSWHSTNGTCTQQTTKLDNT